MRILSVIGTRPEAIKIAPIILGGVDFPGMSHVLAVTGQHGRMIDQALGGFGIGCDIDLQLGRAQGALHVQIGRVREAISKLVCQVRPDLVLVQGDTTSARAAALGAKDRGLRVGHVEAGLRSGDLQQPWPEEENRIAIDAIADYLFAPTSTAVANLASERAPGRVWLTGNTGIDALGRMRARVIAAPALAGRIARGRASRKRLILATCHRHENIVALPGICAALARLGARGDVEIVLPVHPNARVRPAIRAALADAPGVTLVPPLRYAGMVWLLDRCDLVLTDSGGLQEEAPAMGKPALVMRNFTERAEAIATGNLRLIGTDPDRIVAEANRLLDDRGAYAAMSRPAFPFGQGGAAETILGIVANLFGKPRLVSSKQSFGGSSRSKVA